MATPTDGDEARRAVDAETSKLSETYQRWPVIHQVTASLTDAREVNHFSDRLARLFRS